MSLRATGEGHISSIVFRTGVIGPDHEITFDPLGQHRNRMRLSPDRKYQKQLFRRKLKDLVIDDNVVSLILNQLPDEFTFLQMEHAIESLHQKSQEMYWLAETADSMYWLARENYQLRLPAEAKISEMVVFPQSDNEMMGIEDLAHGPVCRKQRSRFLLWNLYGVQWIACAAATHDDRRFS